MSYIDYGHAQAAAGTPAGWTPSGWRRSHSRISWGAVIAGAIVAAASMLLLSFLGIAIGAGGLRLTQTGAAELRTYGLGAGIWTAINLILSMAFGGYIAARLSGTHSHLDGELHGITVWALATLLATLLLAQLASLALGTATERTGVAGSLRQQATPQALVDRLQESLTSNGDPTQMSHDQIRNEMTALTERLLLNGNLGDQDRDRLTALTAAQASITREEAAQRVARMEQRAKAALAEARSAGDTAAGSASTGSKAIFASLLLGLGAAMLGAWFGTRHARVVTPAPVHEPVVRHEHTHTTAYVPQATPPYEPTHDSAVHVYDDNSRPVPSYLRDVKFPATKQELLRLARGSNDEPAVLRRLEQVPDRSYGSLNDLLSELVATA
ncbi:MAG: DUF2795 domain-containing protein [Alphaproteobacteria bacterium]|nr:DUF2795 domain-containing protein [Alphaproteobacteria bacterium]